MCGKFVHSLKRRKVMNVWLLIGLVGLIFIGLVMLILRLFRFSRSEEAEIQHENLIRDGLKIDIKLDPDR